MDATSYTTILFAEAADYTKKSVETRLAFGEKLLGAKSSDSAVQLQSEYAKTSFEGFVVQATKMGELYSNLAKSASIRGMKQGFARSARESPPRPRHIKR
jgi:hypothetical protein